MLENARQGIDRDSDYIEFVAAGAPGVGAYNCADCGYGVTVTRSLPQCPMCAGTTWEQAAWSPFSGTRTFDRGQPL